MSYEEKGKWVYLVVGLSTYLAYLAVILNRAAGKPLTEVPYVAPMLWTIGISIGLSIVGRILIEIARPSDNHKIDVRDKEIDRRGQYVGGFTITVAMLVPFALTLAQADHFWIANAIYAAFVLSASTGEFVKVIAYRRGI